MVNVYIATVSATSNVTAGTEDTFVDMQAPAGLSYKKVRVRVSVETAGSTARIIAKIFRKSATGAGGVAGTIVKKNPGSPASGATVTVKSGATAMAVGTTTDFVDATNVTAPAIWEWIPREEDEKILTTTNGILGINIISSVASTIVRVTIEWIE